jgi:SGNH hydrolase-like domain, acetyltransferase AlgX
MIGRGRVRFIGIGGLGLAAAAGLYLLTVPGFWVMVHRAGRARPAKKARRPPKMSPAPPILSPQEASRARADAIRRTIEGLRAECRQAAGGDWGRWVAQLEPVRAELRAKIAPLKPLHPDATGEFEARSPVLEGKDGFPLFEPEPRTYLRYITEPDSLDEAIGRGESVIAGARWLRRKGIDVLFVTVPKMTEVYAEHFLDRLPPDRILTPHIRRLLLRLLEADVEVLDMLQDLRRERDAGDGPLYLPADPHWAPRAQATAARRVAERLLRYDVVARAQALPPTCEWDQIRYQPASEGVAFRALSPEQQRRAIAAQPKMAPYPRDCSGPVYTGSAPVVCIGDSYNASFTYHLARELNLPIQNLSGGGYTTQAFKEFLREPELLENARVVVWTVCYTDLVAPWPLPRPILEAVGD